MKKLLVLFILILNTGYCFASERFITSQIKTEIYYGNYKSYTYVIKDNKTKTEYLQTIIIPWSSHGGTSTSIIKLDGGISK